MKIEIMYCQKLFQCDKKGENQTWLTEYVNWSKENCIEEDSNVISKVISILNYLRIQESISKGDSRYFKIRFTQ